MVSRAKSPVRSFCASVEMYSASRDPRQQRPERIPLNQGDQSAVCALVRTRPHCERSSRYCGNDDRSKDDDSAQLVRQDSNCTLPIRRRPSADGMRSFASRIARVLVGQIIAALARNHIRP
jgi:hypothetical protein